MKGLSAVRFPLPVDELTFGFTLFAKSAAEETELIQDLGSSAKGQKAARAAADQLIADNRKLKTGTE